MLIDPEIAPHHRIGRKTSAGDVAAALAVDAIRAGDRCGHFLYVVDEKPGHPMFDDFGQRAGRKRHDRGAAGERLHRHQRTRFGDKARYQQAAGGGQQPALAGKTDVAEEPRVESEAGRDLAIEILSMGRIGEYLSRDEGRNPAISAASSAR